MHDILLSHYTIFPTIRGNRHPNNMFFNYYFWVDENMYLLPCQINDYFRAGHLSPRTRFLTGDYSIKKVVWDDHRQDGQMTGQWSQIPNAGLNAGNFGSYC